jgi:hypothetical protein
MRTCTRFRPVLDVLDTRLAPAAISMLPPVAAAAGHGLAPVSVATATLTPNQDTTDPAPSSQTILGDLPTSGSVPC